MKILLITLLSLSAFADGKTLFNSLCASCHGNTGMGDGPVGKALPANQKPANMQLGVFKFAKDEAKFAELLKKGGAAVGLNPLMPAQSQLKPNEISELYKFMTSLKK